MYDNSQSLYLQSDKLKDNAVDLCTIFPEDSAAHSVLKEFIAPEACIHVLHTVKPTIC